MMTPLDVLWSGWRSGYLLRDRPDEQERLPGSVFTRILASDLSDEETHIIFRGALTFAIMNLHPYGVGHVLVLPYREVGELELLSPDETIELWASVTNAVRAVKAAYRPGGVNVGINLGRPSGGSIPEHLHVHVVPRWRGDANFMTATASTRLLPEALDESAAKLRQAWAQLVV